MCENKVLPAQDFVLLVASAGCVVWLMLSLIFVLLHALWKFLESSSSSTEIIDANNGDLAAERNWGLSVILPSGEIDIRLSLQAWVTVICNKHIEHSVQASTTAADFFRLTLPGRNVLKSTVVVCKHGTFVRCQRVV